MDFGRQTRRRGDEHIVPMINVVFLLLIFFLMTAQIEQPDPFDLLLPESGEGVPVDVGDTLLARADGALAYRDARGEAVFTALAQRDTEDALLLRADAGLQASALATLLDRLSAAGQGRVRLLVAAP